MKGGKMRKSACHIPAKLLTAFIIIGAILMLSGCTIPNSKGDGFAIYLTEGDIPPARMPALSHVDIAEPPVISINDIIAYNAQSHEIKLTASAFERILNLDVPVSGKSFVVCVDRNPIYWGAFWTPISSISFDGITIWQPLTSKEPYMITLNTGYPSSSFYGDEDPRNNPEIIASLEQAGKLTTKLSIAEIDKLPRSFKGYELYSWSEDSQWHFTLITGTNRNTALEEIISSEDVISETGWVQIHVAGADAIKDVLSKLHQGEDVFWFAEWRSEQTPPANTDFMLPPEPTIDSIKEHAGQCGLNLTVQRSY
jgi:hypothetical protein